MSSQALILRLLLAQNILLKLHSLYQIQQLASAFLSFLFAWYFLVKNKNSPLAYKTLSIMQEENNFS